jgi:hypothetical protein
MAQPLGVETKTASSEVLVMTGDILRSERRTVEQRTRGAGTIITIVFEHKIVCTFIKANIALAQKRNIARETAMRWRA